MVLPVAWTDKPERDGYYMATSVSAELTDWQGEVVTSSWKLDLTRIGLDNETDLQSRLSGAARANDFALSGERWHAPPIGHYAYYTGTTQPSTMTRTSEDGALTVYRSIPAGVSPRWGCAPADYGNARVRILSEGIERTGVNTAASADDWELSNALVRVRPSGSHLEVAAYDGTQWESKNWNITVAGSAVASWTAVTVLRNDFEAAAVRLTQSRSPGRATLDLTLRRGARFVEGYLQADTSGTLAASLATLENTTSFASAGYVVATSNDGAGNTYTAGSAHNFTAHASGGVSKASSVALDFYLGAVVGGSSAVSGDAATNLRDQYIATLPERVYGVGR
ncbi:hypothetical protein ACRYCC_26315 [Actinomadura scrupuli]|uniref:hypothetical protein n=1 Tax=Actinomadura scrupuli TaxID=559629 RepID=UPI003D9515FA